MSKSPSKETWFVQFSNSLASTSAGNSLAHLSKIFWRSAAVVAIDVGAVISLSELFEVLAAGFFRSVSEPQPFRKTAVATVNMVLIMYR
jgi:hypothetical protein